MKASDLLSMAEAVLATMHEKGLLDESRTGGYMTVLSRRDRSSDTPLLMAEVGKLTDLEKIKKYHRFSREKAERLLLLYVLSGHQTSWESRNPDANLWGGAIYVSQHILSFSGLPELADEALMLAVAVELEMISPEEAHRIANTSNNEVFRQLVEN